MLCCAGQHRSVVVSMTGLSLAHAMIFVSVCYQQKDTDMLFNTDTAYMLPETLRK